jgi:hypothetical protein
MYHKNTEIENVSDQMSSLFHNVVLLHDAGWNQDFVDGLDDSSGRHTVEADDLGVVDQDFEFMLGAGQSFSFNTNIVRNFSKLD